MADPTVRPAAKIALRIPRPIARDYERRGVFAGLRIDLVHIEGAVTYQVEPDLAAQVLADARAQYQRVFTRDDKGVKKSYGHFIADLRVALEPRLTPQATCHGRTWRCIRQDVRTRLAIHPAHCQEVPPVFWRYIAESGIALGDDVLKALAEEIAWYTTGAALARAMR